MRALVVALLCLVRAPEGRGAVRDLPFQQAISIQYPARPELALAGLRKVVVDRDGRVLVLTERGVARLVGETLALDRLYRPLADRLTRDLTVANGEVFYLLDDEYLCNGFAGRYLVALERGVFRRLAVREDFGALLSSPTNLALVTATGVAEVPFHVARGDEKLYAWRGRFYALAANQVFRLGLAGMELVHRGEQLTALAFRGQEILVGSHRGYYAIEAESGRLTVPLSEKVPVAEVTCLAATTNGVWVGTPRGVYFHATTGGFRYFASKRWLPDDEVVDLAPDAQGDLYVLTRGGLVKIAFIPMTLAEKAAHFDRKIRERHIRYGFCAELRLRTAGDPSTAEMIDTDNDGTWSSYYLASQAFRYAATGDENARANAWQTFEALERLQGIHNLEGFPARTFERTGFKVSDPDRWRASPDPRWEWKGHTSSDEVTAQTFACAVLYELAARTPAEKSRIATAYDGILSHIVRHNLYLVDVDNQPTLWGRWNPEYVNSYPPTVVDRRLNSAEIIAFLQFGLALTGKAPYRDQAVTLMQQHGYLANITNSMSRIQPTPGVSFRGHDMGNEWNHSDDLLAFVNYWTLHRYALTEELRRHYALAIADHWNLERFENNPLWTCILAITGKPEFGLEGAVWTLRHYPLDLITWSIRNSHRGDLTRLSANFRGQECRELLPPDERPVMRWNGNPFILDGGDGGRTELAGDEFLLPYWMARHLKLIE